MFRRLLEKYVEAGRRSNSRCTYTTEAGGGRGNSGTVQSLVVQLLASSRSETHTHTYTHQKLAHESRHSWRGGRGLARYHGELVEMAVARTRNCIRTPRTLSRIVSLLTRSKRLLHAFKGRAGGIEEMKEKKMSDR
jgi:hypothetical protein